MKLGVGCMASFPIRDPIVFAYQWATLDLISNGRMWLAACTGIVAGGVSAREGGDLGHQRWPAREPDGGEHRDLPAFMDGETSTSKESIEASKA